MNSFLNSLSSVISFLLHQLSTVTTSLLNNVVFQIAVGIFLFSLVIAIISSFVHIRGRKSNIDD